MLEEILLNIRNWFILPNGIHEGNYTIKDSRIALPFVLPGQFFRILGSVFSTGLYLMGENGRVLDETGKDVELTDETFSGAIWALAVPREVVELSKEITEWKAKNADNLLSPYTSESFGGYSYSKATSKDGAPISWDSVSEFRKRLDCYRRIITP